MFGLHDVEVVHEGEHAVFGGDGDDIAVDIDVVLGFGERAAGHGNVVEEAAGAAVGGVDGADEAPLFREEFAHGGGFHFGEIGASVNLKFRNFTLIFKI